jgi:hypothetical protein
MTIAHFARAAVLLAVAVGCDACAQRNAGDGESNIGDDDDGDDDAQASDPALTSAAATTPAADAGAPDAAAAATVSAASTTGSTTNGATDPIDADRDRCVDTINAYRAKLSLPPLARWAELEPCADGQAKSDSEAQTYHSAVFRCHELGQNECKDLRSPHDLPGCLAAMWAEGPGDFEHHSHYINMSATRYGRVACGFYQTANGSWWAVQDFGR